MVYLDLNFLCLSLWCWVIKDKSKNTNDMKEQILKILDEGKKYGYSNEAVAGELLFLFDAVRQSEQLKAFLLFIQENAPNYRTKQLKPDQVIKAYLESL